MNIRLKALIAGLVAALSGLAGWIIHQELITPDQQVAGEVADPLRQGPSTPPAPGEIARFLPDQSLLIKRADGTQINLEYNSVILDPAWIDIEYFGGWNRESEANHDQQALLFFTGPTFEKELGRGELDMALHGDLLMSNGRWTAGNRAAARGRAFIAVNHKGDLEFGYGDLKPEQLKRYRLFIGGLHAFTNHQQSAPEGYTGVYGEMRLADVRIIYGFRPDGDLEVIETADGVHFDDLRTFVDQRQFEAAYLPDHASKSRLIVPGKRLWTVQQAEWVSGGKPSITQLPFMLRVVPRSELSTDQ